MEGATPRKQNLLTKYSQIVNIYIYRKNKLNEAISWHILKESGEIHLGRDPKYSVKKGKNRKVKFDYYKIKKYIEKFEKECSLWRKFFIEENITPFVIEYKYLCKNYKDIFLKIFDYLEIDHGKNYLKFETDIKRQANKVNKIMAIMYNLIDKCPAWLRKILLPAFEKIKMRH